MNSFEKGILWTGYSATALMVFVMTSALMIGMVSHPFFIFWVVWSLITLGMTVAAHLMISVRWSEIDM